jgi:hypothetical protein
MLASIFALSRGQIGVGVVVRVMAPLFLLRRLNIEVEVGWHIPWILPAAATFIMTVGLLFVAGPARRAVRVDPTEALQDSYAATCHSPMRRIPSCRRWAPEVGYCSRLGTSQGRWSHEDLHGFDTVVFDHR